VSDDDKVDMDVHTNDVPFDRLTKMAATMTAAVETPENADVRGIVFLSDEHRSGIQMFGYEDQSEGIADLFVHMKAIFQSMGKDLEFIGVPESPEGLDPSD
jgi:hypothetical protein